MTIQERHQRVDKLFKDLKDFYEKNFPPGRSLTEEEWSIYLDGCWKIADQYKGTSLEELASELTMALTNDIERVHKAWRKKENELQTTIKEK